MAGLSQGGGVGLALANWMTQGDPGLDIWGMDVARYGPYATAAYTNQKVQENYRRRFRITFPNEELPAGRPLRTTPVYERLTEHNAVWGVDYGLEHALWFQEQGKEPSEEVTFGRSNAWDMVREESFAVRERVGLTEVSNFAKYRFVAPAPRLPESDVDQLASECWADEPLGRAQSSGKILGEFTVSRLGEEEFFLFGSLGAEAYHSRWFESICPATTRCTSRRLA